MLTSFEFVPVRWRSPATDLQFMSGSSIQPRVALQAARPTLMPEYFLLRPECPRSGRVRSWFCLREVETRSRYLLALTVEPHLAEVAGVVTSM